MEIRELFLRASRVLSGEGNMKLDYVVQAGWGRWLQRQQVDAAADDEDGHDDDDDNEGDCDDDGRDAADEDDDHDPDVGFRGSRA